MKIPRIDFVTDSGCERCAEAKARIEKILADNRIPADIRYHQADSMEAGELSVTFGLDDVPSFVVNGRVFSGEKFDEARFLAAVLRR